MTKVQKFLASIQPLSIAPPENIGRVLELIDQNQRITFFSWKMFRLQKESKRLTASPNFDTLEADKYIAAEKAFLQMLLDLNIRFDYIKLIPNELPTKFFYVNFASETTVFTESIAIYFKNVYSQTKVVRMTDLLGNPPLQQLYNRVYNKGLSAEIDPVKFQKEVVSRSTYYTKKPLEQKESTLLATRAFGLFAAETAVILKAFPNPVLLAGVRSLDTYKYEYLKYPKNRAQLPKLFVL